MPRYDGTIYLSTQQVADILQLSRTTLKKYLREKKIPEPKRHPLNGYWLWTLQDTENARLLIAEVKGNLAE